MADEKTEFTRSGGNVFADLGLPHSDQLIAKADLALQIKSIATHRHLTQEQTAELLGTSQPTVSDLFAGKLAGFSMERLIRFLNALDRDVRIVICRKPRGREHATVKVAPHLAGTPPNDDCREAAAGA